MSSWIKGVLVTLVALVTSGLVSVSASATAEQQSTLTFAAATADQTHQALTSQVGRGAARGKRARPITHLSRINALPPRLRTAIDPASLAPKPGTRRDADGLVTFMTGSTETAACLNLRTGAVAPGRCGYLHEPAPRTLTTAYTVLVETVVWFDRHAETYGHHARDTALIAAVADTEVSGFTVSVSDADGDGSADDGRVVLTGENACGTVTLPAHDPAGQTYSSSIAHDAC